MAFTTASSEAAYPKLMEQLHKSGVNDRVTSCVLPLGYSFNLDGSMLYQAFAALFIAQAYGIDLSFGQQLTLLLVMMVSSKGIAGVPRFAGRGRGSPADLGLPEAGLLLIMGIDQFSRHGTHGHQRDRQQHRDFGRRQMGRAARRTGFRSQRPQCPARLPDANDIGGLRYVGAQVGWPQRRSAPGRAPA